MSTNSECILGGAGPATQRAWPLHSVAQTRALEASFSPELHGPSLMQNAGLALARLTLALAPHARIIWVACGPGNNGGDGLEAATHLQRWGKQVIASLAHDPALSPPDAHQAWAKARTTGVTLADKAPAQFDIGLDALFGIGTLRPITATYADWARRMNASAAPTIAVDVPSGLQADTGSVSALHVVADYTLSLLTLKPGLFTGSGRDACGEIWFHDLDVASDMQASPHALLQGATQRQQRLHASHKGSYGDVCIVGGASGMAGAAVLAGRSALRGGSGRVFVCALDSAAPGVDSQYPEMMFRSFAALDWRGMAVVAGCGGGDAIGQYLPTLLTDAKLLVLDADALNRISETPALQTQVSKRPPHSTVMTPHPLEAARLLQCSAVQIQADRLRAAQALAERYQCVIVLKGSGSVIAFPGQMPRINPTGNAKLATAGTGDVLAGLIGARLGQGLTALEASCDAVYRHGEAADHWPGSMLSASDLCHW